MAMLCDGFDKFRRGFAGLCILSGDDALIGDDLVSTGGRLASLVRAEIRSAQHFDARAGGGDGLAVFVSLVDEVEGIGLRLDGGGALRPAGDVDGVEENRRGGEEAEINFDFCALCPRKKPSRGATILTCAPALVKAFFMAASDASSNPSAASTAIWRVLMLSFAVFAILKAGEAPTSFSTRFG